MKKTFAQLKRDLQKGTKVKLSKNYATRLLQQKGTNFSYNDNGVIRYLEIAENNTNDIEYWQSNYKDIKVYDNGIYYGVNK